MYLLFLFSRSASAALYASALSERDDHWLGVGVDVLQQLLLVIAGRQEALEVRQHAEERPQLAALKRVREQEPRAEREVVWNIMSLFVVNFSSNQALFMPSFCRFGRK